MFGEQKLKVGVVEADVNFALERIANLKKEVEQEIKELRELLEDFGIARPMSINFPEFRAGKVEMKEIKQKINLLGRINELAALMGYEWRKGQQAPDGFVKLGKHRKRMAKKKYAR